GLRARWLELWKGSSNLQALFQSPEWFDHLRKADRNTKLFVATAHNEAGELVGVAPLRVGTFQLNFVIKHRTFWSSTLRTLQILGGTPLFPDDEALYDKLFDLVNERFADASDCVFMTMVPKSGFLWDYLQRSRAIQKNLILYVPDMPGAGPTHSIDMPK